MKKTNLLLLVMLFAFFGAINVKAQGSDEQTLPVGSVAPNFTLNDINGKPLSLSSLRGKYVVIDFWGSWCGWCIKGMPEMKKYYAKYNKKLEILGVDWGDTEERWKQAVQDNALPWLQVRAPKESKVISDYMVRGFPTKVIISPDGRVKATVVGESPEFYRLLDEYCK